MAANLGFHQLELIHKPGLSMIREPLASVAHKFPPCLFKAQQNQTMKRRLLTACLIFFALPLSQGADLFAPPAPKEDPYAAYKIYKTSAAFFAATKSGEVPELIKNFRGDYNGLTQLVLDIFRNERRYPNVLHYQASSAANLLVIITRYELADEAKKAEVEREYRSTRRNCFVLPEDANFIGPCESFLKDYAGALKEYIASKKEQEEQRMAAETERQRLVNEARQKALEEGRQAMAAANAKTASIQAEQEVRAAAVMGAIAAREKVREQKLQEVLASPSYKIWQVSLQVEEGLRMVDKAKEILAKDDAIQRESGVTDLAMRRNAGERIVAGKTLVEQAFAIYKKLGGDAREPEDVKAGADPARDYR